MKLIPKTALYILIVIWFFNTQQTWAQNLLESKDGMNPSLFGPAVDTKGHFTVDSSPVLPHLKFSLGLMMDFAFVHSIAVEQQDDVYNTTEMDKTLHAVFMANLGLLNRLAIGMQLPIAYADGTGYNGVDNDGRTATQGWSTGGAFGDIVFHAKGSLLRADRSPIGLAAVLSYQTGTGKPEILLGEPGKGGAAVAKLIVDSEPISWYRAAINFGARYPFGARKENHLNSSFDEGSSLNLFRYGSMLSISLGQSFSIVQDKLDFVVEIYGNQLTSKMDNSAYRSFEANGGFKIYMDNLSYLMLGGAAGLPMSDTDSGYGFQNAKWRLFLGFVYEPSIPDRDGDGKPDDSDQCPDSPEDMDDFEDSDGCPDADNDRDGIPDNEDDCPLIAEDLDGDMDLDGCPEKAEAEYSQDTDGDGIIDSEDKCPNTPEDKDGVEDSDGCPDKDNDSDGFPDTQDKCPEEKEILNGVNDDDGCPDEGEALVNITENQFQLLKGVQFKTASDVIIGEQSFEILNAVVAVLKANPDMRLRVEGHTDSKGKYDYNIKLSQRRADSVRRYLIQNGINGLRLESKGYGPDQPIVTNETEEGRSANRRVVFSIIKD